MMRGRKPFPLPGEYNAAVVLDPPPQLGADAQAEWRNVVALLAEEGFLTTLDRGILIAYCQAYARWMQAERAIAEIAKRDPAGGGLILRTKNGNPVQNPLVGIANRALADIARYSAELGMTPSARARFTGAGLDRLGKKEQQAVAAESAGSGSDWGNDLRPRDTLN
jgi:P27 family predicted phage terminase small subunit